VRALEGPWLLYDNKADPYQLKNLLGGAQYEEVRLALDAELQRRLADLDDEFLPGLAYLEKWGYEVGAQGTVGYTN
jgi:hypothetical protein